MIVVLVGSLALSTLWFLAGRTALTLVRSPAPVRPEAIESTMLLGGFVLAIGAQAVHFVLPLPSKSSAVIVALLFVGLAFFRRSDLAWLARRVQDAGRQRRGIVVTFLLIAIVVGLAAARASKVEDTENYHAQVLRWTEAARLVPGLALVHGRLGFNSLWFPLEALFSFAFLGNGPLPLVNTATFLLGVLFLVRKGAGSRSLGGSFALGVVIPYVAVGFLYAGSQSPDLPGLTYGLLAFFTAIDAFESRQPEDFLFAGCFACAAAEWKLSGVPILLLLPAIVWQLLMDRSLRTGLAWGRAGAFLVFSGLQFVARSVVLSGYPFFPSTAFDYFPVSWKAPNLAHGQQIWVLLFARGFRHEDPAQAATYSIAQWLPLWIGNLNGPARIVMAMLVAGFLLLPVSLIFDGTRHWFHLGNLKRVAIVGVVAIAGAAFWFWQAPDVRFGASYLIALIGLFFLPWLHAVSQSGARRMVTALVFSAPIVLVGQNLLFASPVPPWCSPEYVQQHPERFHWLFPAPYPEATFVEERLRDGSINRVVASGGLAHYAQVPNSPLPIAGLAVRRGANLADGYRLDDGR